MQDNVNIKVCDLIILGQPHQEEIHFLRYILEKIKKKKEFSATFEFIVEFETQFNSIFNSLLQKNKDFIDYRGVSPIIYTSNYESIIGNFEDLIKYLTENFSFIEEKQLSDFSEIAKQSYSNILNKSNNKYAFIQLNNFLNSDQFNDTESRKIVIELFFQVCPKTVMNFLEICKGSIKNKKGEKLSYKNCEIFRVVKNGFIQTGDLSQLNGSKSLYGGEFEDENFTTKHNFPGIIGMIKNKGRSHSNECQFYISLDELKYFDDKYVAFGRIVKGFEFIKKLENTECYLQKPVNRVYIEDCGEFK